MAKRLWLKAFAVFALLACSACATGGPDAADRSIASASASQTGSSVSPSGMPGTDAGASESVSTAGANTAFAHSDPRGDLVGASKEDDWFDEATPAPRLAWGDIVGIDARHTSTALVVRVRFADLRQPSGGKPRRVLRIGITVKTSHRKRDVELWVPTGQVTMMSLNDGEDVACHIDHPIDVGQRIVTQRIPRSCLGNPQWVRVDVNCLAFQADGKTMTLDNALATGYDIAHEYNFSPPIYAP
jgi:hypothetical protein